MVRRMVVCANWKAQGLGAPGEAIFGSLSQVVLQHERQRAEYGSISLRKSMWEDEHETRKRALG